MVYTPRDTERARVGRMSRLMRGMDGACLLLGSCAGLDHNPRVSHAKISKSMPGLRLMSGARSQDWYYVPASVPEIVLIDSRSGDRVVIANPVLRRTRWV